jgi:predicted membrane channel-forming protein YqfA (hemolysin III family)
MQMVSVLFAVVSVLFAMVYAEHVQPLSVFGYVFLVRLLVSWFHKGIWGMQLDASTVSDCGLINCK